MKVIKYLLFTGAFAVAMTSCGSEEKSDNTESTNTTSGNKRSDSTGSSFEGAERPMRIAYVNVDTINVHYKRMEAARKKFEEEYTLLQKEYETKMRSFQAWSQKVQQNFDTYLRSKQEQVQQELVRRQQELQQFEQEMQMKLSQKEADLSRKNLEKIQEFCKSYAERKGFDYVLSYQMGGQVLYANDQYDITKEVLKELNEDYESANDMIDSE